MTSSAIDTVLELSTAFVTPRALHVVAELGVPDALGEQPRSAAELAADCGANPDSVHRLLRLLESNGVFATDEAGQWCHNEASRLLRSDHPTSMRAYARMSGLPFSWGSVTNLDHAARTGHPGASLLDPNGLWGYLAAHPQEAAVFDQAMTSKAHGDVAAVLATCDFAGYRRIADIGGGRGHLLAAVLDRYDRLTGVLFDQPHVTAQVPATDRFEVVAGDFFADPLPAADCYVLMNIIHDWADERATDILRAVASAGRSTAATVLLVEVLLPEGPEPHWAKVLDAVMLAVTGGRERTVAEYRALLDRAGIDVVRTVPTATAFSILECRVGGGDR